MTSNNPLQKYFRQPKIFIKLPSKGLYYEPGVLAGDYNNVPIFAMTGMDEIIYKTPDALYSGEATAKIVESCCPYISDGKKVPSTDIDALIVAIRIATFGENITIEKSCPQCSTENTYDVSLNVILDHYADLTFSNQIEIAPELVITIRPLKYFEMNHYSIENFKMQKMLAQLDGKPEEEQQKYLDEIYKDLADLQLDLLLTSIETVNASGQIISDKQVINEWLENSERDIFTKIKDQLEKNRDLWAVPQQPVMCASCSTPDKLTVILDQSNFFD